MIIVADRGGGDFRDIFEIFEMIGFLCLGLSCVMTSGRVFATEGRNVDAHTVWIMNSANQLVYFSCLIDLHYLTHHPQFHISTTVCRRARGV